ERGAHTGAAAVAGGYADLIQHSNRYRRGACALTYDVRPVTKCDSLLLRQAGSAGDVPYGRTVAPETAEHGQGRWRTCTRSAAPDERASRGGERCDSSRRGPSAATPVLAGGDRRRV